MATARDIGNCISAAADCLDERGHEQVSDALKLFLAGADDFAACMGAARGWRSAARLRARDVALRALVRHVAPDGPVSVLSLAKRIASIVGRYHDTGWKADRRAGRRPDDPLLGLVFDLLCTTKPLAVRTIRLLIADIVGNQNDGACQHEQAA